MQDLKILVDKMVPLGRANELVGEPNSRKSQTPQFQSDDDGPPVWLEPKVEVNFSNPHLEINIPVADKNLLQKTLKRIKSILSRYPGQTPVVLLLQNSAGKPTYVPLPFKISQSSALKSALQTIIS